MNRTIIFIILLQLISIILPSKACYFSDSENRMVCNNFEEAAAEYTEDWYNLWVENSLRPLCLKANSFINMTSILELEVSNLKGIEAGAFNGLRNLDKLTITNTDLEEIPAEVYDGLKIRTLEIYDNSKFKILPPNYFDKLPQLRSVDMRITNLDVIPSGVFNNTDIDLIWLDNGHLHTIEDDAFADMRILSQLSVSKNNLKTFKSKRILGKSYSITSFWVSANHLTKIDTELLEGFPVLEELYIEVNDINYIEPKVFFLTPSLNFLDISNNKLVALSPESFLPRGSKLYYLFLHNNRFTFLDKSIFYRNTKIRYITYGGNPFQCTCEKEIKELTDQRNMTRLCEDIYVQGERPTCITTKLSSRDCIYDVVLTADLYNDFIRGLKDYPVLQQQCDTTEGVENAKLTPVL